jgi:hypothetical protein
MCRILGIHYGKQNMDPNARPVRILERGAPARSTFDPRMRVDDIV